MIDVQDAKEGEAMNVVCAEALGWKQITTTEPIHWGFNAFPPGILLWERPDGTRTNRMGIPKFSEYIDAAWQLEEAIDDRGAYLIELIRIINYDNHITEDDFNLEEACVGADWLLLHDDVWRIAWATPHQRARAFLLTCGITEIKEAYCE